MKKLNPTICIKILKGSYKVANENGILDEFLFYYELKGLRIDGFFKRGTIQNYSEQLGRSKGNIYSKLTKLVNAGFIRKGRKGHQLISYDDFWKKLGFDLSERINFKVIKIRTVKGTEFKYELFSNEIDYNLKSQEKRAIKGHIYKEAERNPDTDIMPSKISRSLKKKFSHKLALRKQYLDIRGSMNYTDVNYDFSLSCQGVANLFGYGSAMQGHFIKKELVKRGLLKVTKRPAVFITNNVDRNTFNNIQVEYPDHPVWSKCFMTNEGVVLLKRPDLLEITDEVRERCFYSLFYKLNAKRSRGISIKGKVTSRDYKRGNTRGNNRVDIGNTNSLSLDYMSNTFNKNRPCLKHEQVYINPITMREGKLY